ncbi:MAG: hypothetical protein AAF657_25675 [Acidobacteriota bacterium]
MYLLGSVGGIRYQEPLWRLRQTGSLRLHDLSESETDRMASLMTKYADTPMDLADASLVAAAERLSLNEVFTIDSHFYAYRLPDGSALDIVR